MSDSLLSSVSSGGSAYTGSLGLLAGNARAQETSRKFASLIDGIQAGMDTAEESVKRDETLSSSSIASDPRLPGDFISSFKIENPTDTDHHAPVSGAAANSGMKGTVDKSSKLYEQALELESYFVKMMLSSMRNTVQKSGLSGENDFASKMYDDMLYDELSRDMTKNAGFGLADQVYLQLSGNN